MVQGLGDMGLSLAFAAVGSGLGAGVAGMAAAGAWKKAYLQNRAAPFLLITFVGAPLSQTIYGMIIRNAIRNLNLDPVSYPYQLILGLGAGIALGVSAWYQGKAGASCADALAETGQGFANYLIVIGIVETVALFVLAFTLTALPKV